MANIPNMAICAVIVTYAARHDFVHRTVQAALAVANVSSVVIIDNASTPSVAELASEGKRIQVIRNERNLGSAGGYNMGLTAACELDGATHVLLLDDDLLISDEIVQCLREHIAAGKDDDVWVVPRDDRPTQKDILAGRRSGTTVANSFHDFHVVNAILSGLGRARSAILKSGSTIAIDHAPFAGLFIPIEVVRNSPKPDSDFFVYCDDYDFVMKLVRAGHDVYLTNCPAMTSIDESWNQVSNIAPAMFAKGASAFRMFYSVRNRVAYECRYIRKNKAVYYVNMAVYFFVSCIAACLEQKSFAPLSHFKIIGRAISDGLHERLGEVSADRYSL